MSFFTTSFMTSQYVASSPQSAQGQLASSYTTALTTALQSAQVADYIAFLAYQSGMSIEDAVALKTDITAGNFSLSGLFGAAQSKSGPVDGASISDPDPTMTVGGVTIHLKDILGGLDTETWSQSNTIGNGKKATVETVFHTREFYTDTHEPTGYDADWANPNEAPTVDGPVVASFSETQSEFTDHVRTNESPDWREVDLTSTASDPDGDALSVTDLAFSWSNGSITLVDGVDYKVEGNKLLIDVNSRSFDDLLIGETDVLTVTYKINDGHGHEVDATAEVTITGTGDEYQREGEGSADNTHYKSEGVNGNVNNQILAIDESELPEGFDFTFSGTLTADATGLTKPVTGNAQTVGVRDAGSEDWSSGAINFTPTSDAPQTVILDAAALSDGQVDYNVTFNNSADATDNVTITLNYTYDYWVMA